MANERKCKNPHCHDRVFHPKKLDQEFCTTRCRNQYNNYLYKLKMAPYKKIGDALFEQDTAICNLLKSKEVGFLKYDDFKAYSIDFDNARQLHFGENQKVEKAIFVKFEITLFKDPLYKIKKI